MVPRTYVKKKNKINRAPPAPSPLPSWEGWQEKKKIIWSFLWRFARLYKSSGEKIHFCAPAPTFSVSWASDNSTARISGCLYQPCDTFRDQTAFSAPAVTAKLKSIANQICNQAGLVRTCQHMSLAHTSWPNVLQAHFRLLRSVPAIPFNSMLGLEIRVTFLCIQICFKEESSRVGNKLKHSKALSPGLSN